MKKNKVLSIIIYSIGVFVLSVFFSFILSNFNVLKLDKSERKITNIRLNDVRLTGLDYDNNVVASKNSKKQNIKIFYKGYINKLVIEYKTKENFDLSVNYKGYNYYKKRVNKTKNESFNLRLNKSYTKINEKVNNITLDLNDGKNFSISKIKIDNRITFNWYLTVFIFICLILLTILILYFKKKIFKNKIEYLFLSFSVLIGFLFVLFQPYTTSFSWDDQIHYSNFYRIFELDGTTKWTKADHDMTEISPFLNIDTIEERKEQNKYLNNSTKIVKTEENSPLITYNSVGYIIPGLIMKLCSIIKIPFTLKIILAKLASLLFYSMIIFYAIKIIPRGKAIISVLGLMPTSIFLATQFSYDSPIIACMCLFVAKFLSIIEDKNKKINLFDVIILVGSIIFASFIKAIYIPIILILLLIDSKHFNNKKQNIFFKIGTIIIFVLLALTFVLPATTEKSTIGDTRGGNTSTSGQTNLILHKPFGYMNVLKDTAGSQFAYKLVGDGSFYSFAYLSKTNNLNNINSNNVYYIYLIILIFTVITDSYLNINYKNKNLIKISSIILLLGTIVLIWTALYISFTPVGEVGISGVQNRYFIPILYPLLLIVFSTNKIKNNFDKNKYDAILFSLILIIFIDILYKIYYLGFCV